MYSNLVGLRQWPRVVCYCRSMKTIASQELPDVNASSDGISPPPRIPRGPTDILQALAATVGTDPTAAHYKYHDDPYLIPLSNFRKRSYALSAEAGRKAATWIKNEHADLFTTRVWDPPLKMITPHFNADPIIDAYAPKPIYNEESKVTENDLKLTIKNVQLEDSITIFRLLGGSEAISEESKIELLQLLCFYNEKEPDSAEWLEERWFAANTRERQIATWRMGGLVDNIFTSMNPKTPEAYCAVIQGMAKYCQAERALMLIQEAHEKGIPLSSGVYNSLLSCIGFLKEGTSLRMDTLKSTLTEMDEKGISPNEETLTACLKSISAWGAGKMLQQFALQIVAEFKQLDIQPGLSAYYYLLCLFCKERGPRVNILEPILNDLEKRDNLEAKEATDTNFFITAMGVCSDHLRDLNLAERLHALLMKDDNYKLVGDAYKESIYYRHFVTVACRNGSFEKTTQLLDMLIPNIYVPEPSVMEEIIKTLELSGAGDRLAQAWSQLIVFGHAKRPRLVESLLSAMISCYQYQDVTVKEKMRAAATDIVNFSQKSEEQEENNDGRIATTLKISATALSNIIELCSDVPDKSDSHWQSVSEALKRLRRGEATGVPNNPQALADVAQKAASHGKQGIAAAAVAYLAECGFEEAVSASVKTLEVILNRSAEEVETLLRQPKAQLSANLHPSVLAIAETYQLAKTGAGAKESESTTSSDSDSGDSDSTSDEE